MGLIPLSQVEDALSANDQGQASVPSPQPSKDTVTTLDEAQAFHDIPITTKDAPKQFWQTILPDLEVGLSGAKHQIGSMMVFMGNTLTEKVAPYLAKEFNVPLSSEPTAQDPLKNPAYPVLGAKGLGKFFIQTGYAWQDQVNKFIAQKEKETEGAPTPPYLRDLTKFTGSMAGLIGTSLIAGPGTALGGMTVGSAAETYQKARLKGKTFDDATKIGAAVGIAVGTPSFIGLGAILKLAGSPIEKMVQTALIQGVDLGVMRAGTETVEHVSGITDSQAKGIDAVKETIGLAVRDASMGAILAPATGMVFAMQKRAEIKTELKKTGMQEEEATKLTDALLAKGMEHVVRTADIEQKLMSKGITRTEEGGFVNTEGQPVTPERALAETVFKSPTDMPAIEQAKLIASEALPQRETIGVTSAEKEFVSGQKAIPNDPNNPASYKTAEEYVVNKDRYNGFSLKSTGMPTYDSILDTVGVVPTGEGVLTKQEYYKKFKGLSGEIRVVSPDMYIKQTLREFHKQSGQDISLQEYVNNHEKYRADNRKSIDKLKEAISTVGNVDMPTLVYDKSGKFDTQEGLHRAIAAKELGIKEIPVLYVNAPIEVGTSLTERLTSEWQANKSPDVLGSDTAKRLEAKLTAISEKFKRPEAITKQKIKTLQSEFDSFIRNAPLEPADKAKFLASIKQVQTIQQLRRILPDVKERIGRLVEAENVRNEIARFKDLTAASSVKRAREPYQETIRSLIKDLTPTKVSTRKGMYLDQLAKHTQEFPDQILPKERLDELASLDKKSLRDMTSEEIGLINDAIEQVYKLSEREQNFFDKGKAVKKSLVISQAVKNITAAAKEIKVSKEVATGEEVRKGLLAAVGKWQGITTVRPETNFITVEGKDNGVLQKFVFGNINQALSDRLRFTNEGRKFLQESLKGLDLTKWSQYISRDYKKLDLITVEAAGEKIKLTKAQTLWLYLAGKNENSARHLFEGGFSINGEPEKIYHFSAENYAKIEDAVSADPSLAKVADTFHHFFDGFIKEALNKTSYELSGVHVAKEDNYIKITVNPLHTPKLSTREFYTGQVSLEGMGFLQARQKSKLPVMMEDVFGLMQEALDHAGAYVSYAEPFRTAKGILNDTTVRQTLAKAGRSDYIESFNNYLRRVEGQITTVSDVEKGLRHLLTNAQAAILMVNPKILAKQPVSVLAALTEMPAKYLFSEYGKPLKVSELKDIEQYSPQLFARWQGHISRELSELKNEGRIRELFTGKMSVTDKFMTMYQAADHPMVDAIWRGATAEMIEKFPDLKGHELKQKIAERAEFVVRRTQAAVFTEHRSEAHADMSLGGRTFTLFSSETNTQQDMLVRAWRGFLRGPQDGGAKLDLARKVLIVSYLNSFMIANINAIANIFIQSKDEGRRDEAQQDWELIGKRWISDFLLGPAGAFYIGRDVANIIQETFLGYAPRDITNPAFQMLSGAGKGVADLLKAGGQFASGETYQTSNRKEGVRKNRTLKWDRTFWRGIVEVGENLGMALKLPIPTVMQWGPALFSWVEKFFKGEK